MRNYSEEIGAILNEAIDVASRQCPETRIVSSRSEIRLLLAEYAPTLMFYGTYNAGKSTLLNALLDTDEAPTSDAPCTAAINSYDLKGYTVFDTPGIDAPVEHERLSKEHLLRCHAVVFVLSTHGQFDEANVIGEIKRIYDAKKPLILALNNKSGATVESGELDEVTSKLIGNCVTATGDVEFSRRVPVLLVNAKTALTARARNSETLLSASGIVDLEQVILQSLKSINQLQLLLVPIDLIGRGLDQLLVDLEAKRKDQSTVVVDALLVKVREIRTDADQAAALDIRALRNGFIQSVIRTLHDGGNMEDCFRDYLESVQASIQHRIVEASNQIENVTRTEENLAQVVISQYLGSVAGSEANEGLSGGGFSLTPEMKQGLVKFVSGEQSTELVKNGLLKLRSLKFSFVKGRWESTLAKWAGKFTRGVGVFLQVAIVAYEIYAAKKAQEKYEAELARREQELQESARNMANSCESEVIEQVPSITKEAFAEFEAELGGQREALSGNEQELAEACDRVRSLKERIEALRASLALS